jgi:hypothetical protein
MKIAAVGTTKNEADVIEAFVRHNARFVDAFYFIDESVDSTREILLKMSQEGFKITILNSSSTVYEQRLLITSALRVLAESDAFDWVFLLDADEFLPDLERSELELLLASLPPRHLASMNWKTYIPTSSDYHSFDDPISQMFLPRSTEGPGMPIYKVCVPTTIIGDIIVDPGNHGAHDARSGASVRVQNLPIPLCHVPVRSIEQIIVKNIVAAHVTSMKEHKTAVEGWHVYASLEQMRSRNFEVSYDELKRVALNYAIDKAPEGLDINLQGRPLRTTPVRMNYHSLRYRNPIAALDREMEAMARQIAMHRKAATATRRTLEAAQESLQSAMGALAATQSKSA